MAAKAKGVGASAKAANKTTPVTPPLAGWMGGKAKGSQNPGVAKKGAMGKPTVRKK
jgi:hypothetical protein